MRCRVTTFATAALCVLWLACTAAAEAIDFAGIDPADHAFEHWFLETLDDRPSGYWRMWLEVEDDRIRSGYDLVGVEVHAGERMKTRTRVEWTETTDFKPIHIVVQTQAGSEVVKQTYRFTDAGVTLTSEQDGRSIETKRPPFHGDYLTNAQQIIATNLHVRRGDASFEINTLDPVIGTESFLTRYRKTDALKRGFKQTDGETFEADEWAVTYSMLPGFALRCWMDDRAQTHALSFDVGGMTKAVQWSDASVKQAKLDPPDSARRSVVVPDRPIRHHDRARRLVYDLRYDAGDAELLPVSTTHQAVEKRDDGVVRMTVDLDARPNRKANRADAPTDADLAPSILINHEDVKVRELAMLALQNLDKNASPMQIALACKRQTGRTIRGGSNAVGNASASEVARTGTGDCTEHAVLLAALLRAHGIPSRCVSGLVYSPEGYAGIRNAFVHHMWTQAWIKDDDHPDGRWVDLDAAMVRYTAGHIALGVSSMADDGQADQVRLVPLTRGLTIRVVEQAP